MRSLKSRLFLGLGLGVSLLLIAQWAIINLTLGAMMQQQWQQRLQGEAERLLASVDFASNGMLELQQTQLRSVYQTPFSGFYFSVCANFDCQSSRSLWDTSLPPVVLPIGEQRLSTRQGPEQQALLSLDAAYRKQGRTIHLVVAEDISPWIDQKTRLQWQFTALSLLGLLGLIIALRQFLAHALQPLHSLQRDLNQLAAGHIQQLPPAAFSELEPLVQEMNHLLEVFTIKNKRSREALGNLAHALKTRLSLLTPVASQLGQHPEWQTEAEDLRALSRNLQAIIDRELKRARMVGATVPGQAVAIPPLIEELLETLRLIYGDRHLEVELELMPDLTFVGDKEDLLELVGNILDNAFKWAKHRIRIQVEQDHCLRLQVDDDGPGCDPLALNQLTTRGFRLDERQGGSGLGLAIVEDIVQQYGGQLQLSRSTVLGGHCVRLELPVTRQKKG